MKVTKIVLVLMSLLSLNVFAQQGQKKLNRVMKRSEALGNKSDRLYQMAAQANRLRPQLRQRMNRVIDNMQADVDALRRIVGGNGGPHNPPVPVPPPAPVCRTLTQSWSTGCPNWRWGHPDSSFQRTVSCGQGEYVASAQGTCSWSPMHGGHMRQNASFLNLTGSQTQMSCVDARADFANSGRECMHGVRMEYQVTCCR